MRESESAVARRESLRKSRQSPGKLSLAGPKAVRVAHEPVFLELGALLKVAPQRQSGGLFVLNVEVTADGTAQSWTLDVGEGAVYRGTPPTPADTTVDLTVDTLERWLNNELQVRANASSCVSLFDIVVW